VRQGGFSRIESNYAVKSLVPIQILAKLGHIIRRQGTDILHVADNYGPMQTLLARLPTVKSSSFLTYFPRYLFYNEMLSVSLHPFDRIVTGSDSITEKLVSLGFLREKIQAIPWGVDSTELGQRRRDPSEVKRSLGLAPDTKLIVWTGFVPGMAQKDYRYAISLARELLNRTSKVAFIFMFKPSHFRTSYLQDGLPPRLRIVRSQSSNEFLDVMNAAVALLSPMINPRVISAPPLTWLECMASGAPIISTYSAAASTALEEGVAGLFFSDSEEFCNKTLKLCSEPSFSAEISANVRKFVGRNYDMGKVASQYLGMWRSLVESV